MFTQAHVQYIFHKMMLLINLHPLKHSYVKFFCESNFALILEIEIFYHFNPLQCHNLGIFQMMHIVTIYVRGFS